MKLYRISTYLSIILSTVILCSCAHKTQDPLLDIIPKETQSSNISQTMRPIKGKYIKVSWSEIPQWSIQQTDQLVQVLRQNCKAIARPISNTKTRSPRANPQAWQSFCNVLEQQNEITNPISFLEEHLQPWRTQDSGKTTGYYIPIVKGSTQKTAQYQWPLLATPSDLITVDPKHNHGTLKQYRYKGRYQNGKLVPYHTREYIHKHLNQFKALVWLEDPIEALFLQVQGSGYVQLTNGQQVLLAYDNHNGHPYISIGKYLLQTHQITPAQASMQGIKQWAKKQSKDTIIQVLNKNPSLPFFKMITSANVSGAYGIPLTGQRSVAVDPNYIPLGTPIFISSRGRYNIHRLVFAHDTGSAIKGASRIDYFWGIGDEAGESAGQTNQRNHLWILWPKDAGLPSAK